MYSPWGKIQHIERYMRGFNGVSTSSHGGFRIGKKLLRDSALNFEIITKWAIEDVQYYYFEEDCAVNLVFVDCPKLLEAYVTYRSKTERPVNKDDLFNSALKSATYWFKYLNDKAC